MLRVSVIAAAVLACANAEAADIYKCVTSSATSYQSTPCEDPGSAVSVPLPPHSAFRPPSAGRDAAEATAGQPSLKRDEATARGESEAGKDASRFVRLRSGAIALTVGMWDTDALNAPQWGRPDDIARSRDRLGWREWWSYARGGRVRELEFLNARLVDIKDADMRLAGLERQRPVD